MSNTTVPASRQENATALLQALIRAIDEFWDIENQCKDESGQWRPYPIYKMIGPIATDLEKGRELISRTFDYLLEVVDYDQQELSRLAATIFFRPANWIEQYAWDYSLPERERYLHQARGEIIQAVLDAWLRLNRTIAVYALMAERISTLLRMPGIKLKPDLYPPTLPQMVEFVVGDSSQISLEMSLQIVAGEMGKARPGAMELLELQRSLTKLFLHLWKNNWFDYTIFRESMYNIPGAFTGLSVPYGKVPIPEPYRDIPTELGLMLQSYCHTLSTELVERLTTGDLKAAALLKQAQNLKGFSWLLLACAFIEEKKVQSLPTLSRWKQSGVLESAVVRLCQSRRAEPAEENQEQVARFLSQYQQSTLLLVLPYALEYQDIICEALGWPEALELVKTLSSGKLGKTRPDLPDADKAEAIFKTFAAAQPTSQKLIEKLKG